MYDVLNCTFSFGYEIYDREHGFIKSNDNSNFIQLDTTILSNHPFIENNIKKSCFLENNAQDHQHQHQHQHQHVHALIEDEDEDEYEYENQKENKHFDSISNLPVYSFLENEASDSKFPIPKNRARYNCLSSFNPVSKEMLEKTTNHWSHVYLQTIDRCMKAPEPHKL